MIQARYETVRLVKYDGVSVTEAVERFGFKARSSYYLFARLMREEGFAGIFDMRPLNRRIYAVSEVPKRSFDVYGGQWGKRPRESLWEISHSPWHNAFYGLQKKHHCSFVQVIRAFAEGNGVRGISRIFDIDKNTVLKYLQRAASQCRRVTNLFVCGLHVEEMQIDEMWTFVCKKEKNLSEAEYISQLKGDQWCWVVLDARTKVMVQYEIGKRTYTLARDLIGNFRQRTDGAVPSLVTSDEYKGYPLVLLEVFGIPASKRRKLPPPEMDYAVVSKTRKKGRVVDIKVKMVFGSLDRLRKKLELSPVSKDVNVSFVERSHLSRRQFNRRTARKTLGFSKKLRNHRWQYELETAIYNFVRPHMGLRKKTPAGLLQERTPMMAAGKTDHPWSIEEILSYVEN